MAIDVYLHIDGIRGASTDERHKDWIECTSVDWIAGQASSASCQHTELLVSKLADPASPILLQTCCSGRKIPKAKFEFMRADGHGIRIKYLEIEIEDVSIGTLLPQPGKGGNLPEQLGFRFARVKWRYAQP